MAEMSAERLAQLALECGVLTQQQIDEIWRELSPEASIDEFVKAALRKGLLTRLQIERLVTGKRDGYFYGTNKLLYVVGAGTFARVYRAVNVENGRNVAVKVLRQRYSDDLNVRENFVREAELVKPLRHINIVPIYEVSLERNRPYMVMEFVEGNNLRDFVRVRPLGVLDSMRLIADIASGLDYAFRQGLSHRDLKLSNVLVTSKGRAKLVDFGLAAMETAETGQGESNPRSIDYAGLERITGVRRNDKRSDLYFAGCMLYHMLTGESPLFETRDRARRLSVQRFRDIKPLNQVDPSLPIHVIQVVNRAMDMDPNKRYQTPAEFLADVSQSVERLEKGDTAPAEAGGNGEAKITEAVPSRTTHSKEGQDNTVMVLAAGVELQNLLREALKKRGYRVLVIGDPKRALKRWEDDPEVANCLIVSALELEEAAIDAFNEFGEDDATKDVPAILLVDKHQAELAAKAQRAPHRRLVPMPLKMKILRAMLLKLLNISKAT